MNITEEGDNTQIIKYLEKFGKVEIIKPIKNIQGNRVAKNGYFLSLFYNSSIEDKEFVKFCNKNNVVVQLDIEG